MVFVRIAYGLLLFAEGVIAPKGMQRCEAGIVVDDGGIRGRGQFRDSIRGGARPISGARTGSCTKSASSPPQREGFRRGAPTGREVPSVTSFRHHTPSLWRKIVGWACVVVGLLGFILPIIPGIPFLILGLVTLATQHRWARALLVWFKRRYRSLMPKKNRPVDVKAPGQG